MIDLHVRLHICKNMVKSTTSNGNVMVIDAGIIDAGIRFAMAITLHVLW